MSKADREVDEASRYAVAKEACQGAKVLDLGCGSGSGAERLVRWGARSVTGVDDAPGAVEAATKRVAGARFVVADACSEDGLPDLGKFDLVLALGLVEDVDSPLDLFRTIKARLAAGGTAIVTCPASTGQSGPVEAAKAFSKLASPILGKPSQVMLAVPITGVAVLDMASEPSAADDDVFNAVRIPTRTDAVADGCRYIVGVWGTLVPDVYALARQEGEAVPAASPRRTLADVLRRLGIRRRDR